MPFFKNDSQGKVEIAVLLRVNGKVLVEIPVQIPIPIPIRIGVSTVDTAWLRRQLSQLRQYKSGFSRN